jgi:predicted phage tail protein
MGNAARRRKDRRRKDLVEMSFAEPEVFDGAWEMRLESWLCEVGRVARRWDGGATCENRVFSILEEAMAVLAECAPEIRKKYSQKTYDTLCHECCTQVARVTDRRLYRLSNANRMETMKLIYGEKEAGEY